MNQYIRQVMFWIVLLLACGLTLDGRAQQISSELTYPNCAPQTEATGTDSFAIVWQGLLNRQNRILLQRIQSGSAGAEELVDSGLPGDHRAPQIAAGEDGLLLAWTLRNAGTDTIYFGRETPAGWKYTQVAELPRPSLCAGISLAAVPGGGARVAYQAHYADLSEVFLVEIDAAGNAAPAAFQIANPLTQYQILPQVFGGGSAPLLWYTSEASGVRLMGAAPSASGVWREFPAAELLPGSNADCLPILSQSESGELIGVWYELVSGADRIFLSRQSSNAGARIVDQRSRENNRIPAATVLPGGEITVVWTGETKTGSAVFYRIGNEPQQIVPESAVFLNNARQACTGPQIAGSPNGAILIVWQSDDYHTGTGHIYHSLIPAP